MSLEALAPDQRAVVGLVLQQGRSFADLAGMLGISEDAVRERAHRGLAALATPQGLDAEEQGEVADYLLNQGSPSAREATRSLLRTAPEANRWAAAVAGQLTDLPGARLPDVPAARTRPTRPAAAPVVADDVPVTDGVLDEPFDDAVVPADGAGAAAAAAAAEGTAASRTAATSGAGARASSSDPEPAVRARPRPRPARAVPAGAAAGAAGSATADPDAPTDEPLDSDRGAAPPSSRLGGMLLIAAVAIVVVAGVVFLLGRGDDDADTASNGSGGASTATASTSPTATATPNFQALGQVRLRNPQGGKAKGAMVIYADQAAGKLAFTVEGTGVPANTGGDAYAVWLVGGDAPHRLGYSSTPVTKTGKLGLSGPQESDAANFQTWFTKAKRVVVTRETQEDATTPGPVVLQGTVPSTTG